MSQGPEWRGGSAGGFRTIPSSRRHSCVVAHVLLDLPIVVEAENGSSERLLSPTGNTSRSESPFVSYPANPGNHKNKDGAAGAGRMQSMVAVVITAVENSEQYTRPHALQILQESSVQSVDVMDEDYRVSNEEDNSALRPLKQRKVTAKPRKIRPSRLRSRRPGTSVDRARVGRGRCKVQSAAATERPATPPCSGPGMSGDDSEPISDSVPRLAQDQALMLASTVAQAIFETITGSSMVNAPVAQKSASATSSAGRTNYGERTCARWTSAEVECLTDLKKAGHPWLKIEEEMP